VRRAFGAAYERDGIIPVAMVAGGGGGARGGKPAAGPDSLHEERMDAGRASADWCCPQAPTS
jgi:hypothetical protein